MDTTREMPVRLVIVGHIDHGKSTLIGRLLCDAGALPDQVAEQVRRAGANPAAALASITDHLAEERREEKTIDTAQVFFRAGGRHYVIIDTPGHAEFLKNMFTGASRADAALLVIDAAEGLRPQTLAHVTILALLGIRFVVPVVNKMDKVEYSPARFDELIAAIAVRLRQEGIEPQAGVPIAALTGENVVVPSSRLNWYSGPTLLETLAQIPAPVSLSQRPLRFAIQGLFEVNDQHLSLGRVEAGTLHAGQTVLLLPAALTDTVHSIAACAIGRTLAESVEAGESAGVAFGQTTGLARGVIVCDPSVPPLFSRQLTGRLVWLSDVPLTKRETVELRIATQEIPAVAGRISENFHSSSPDQIRPAAEQLCYGEIGVVTLDLSRPIAWESFSCENTFGTFVLMRQGEVAGAGILP